MLKSQDNLTKCYCEGQWRYELPLTSQESAAKWIRTAGISIGIAGKTIETAGVSIRIAGVSIRIAGVSTVFAEETIEIAEVLIPIAGSRIRTPAKRE